MAYYSNYETAISRNLNGCAFTSSTQSNLDNENGLDAWVDLATSTRNSGGTLYFIGNGASATMASHMALDFTKNGGINALPFNDSAFLTAISNDISYDSVFSFCIEKFGQPGDLLVAISSSGNSANIINGVNAALKKGVKTVTLSGMKPTNSIRKLGDLNVYIPAKTYGIVECCHQILLHCWLDRYMGIEPK
jgi:D-sedoheptulose 7-phosphate isomerase